MPHNVLCMLCAAASPDCFPRPFPTFSPCRYDTRKDMKFEPDAPVIGLVLQRSHLVTGDAGHYDGVVSELESRGAKVGHGALSSAPQDLARQSQSWPKIGHVIGLFVVNAFASQHWGWDTLGCRPPPQ